ncbi:hypothetical protein FJ987_15410 [Mesorhizobium sp. CU2]|uniref:hypothetical protein n=1 Tax=unclassified Mesorhizobium TaxID=325217 RepID=UPI00112E2CF6|nr:MULTISPECIES: hypothetical protein [unclassified Mesorhizobium]TPN89673.1 hypothetical protein FJ988_01785 [Mesorhizobium sp. CU3]TPO13938.1 hypothetical protein FJ987_15410 [Mesorhizobium sp. CU2]
MVAFQLQVIAITPHPTSLREATFSHKGRREVLRKGRRKPPTVELMKGGSAATFLLALWEKVAERSSVG